VAEESNKNKNKVKGLKSKLTSTAEAPVNLKLPPPACKLGRNLRQHSKVSNSS
jgi:hypothetical protein